MQNDAHTFLAATLPGMGFHEEYPLVLCFELETAFVTTSACDVWFSEFVTSIRVNCAGPAGD